MADRLDPWTAFHQNGPTANLPSRPTHRQDHHPPQYEEEETNPNTADFKVDHHLWGVGVHQNVPASDTKLTHSLGIYSIGPPLVMDKLIPVISRAITSLPEMGPLLDVECMPAVIIKLRFILDTHTEHLSRNKTFN